MIICKNELDQLKANDFKLVFHQPSEAQTKTVMTGSLAQQSKLKELRDTIAELKKLGMSNDEIFEVIEE